MSHKPTLANTPQHDELARIIRHHEVKNVQALFIEKAQFRGSQPLSGLFQVADLDECMWQDKEGVYHIEVICSWHGTDPDEEWLVLTTKEQPVEGIVGWDGEVVAEIG